jgi:hypothetical protein
MISDDCIRRQLRRFSNLVEFPTEPDSLLDLREALSSAPSDESLEGWTSGWIHESAFSPRPAEVYQAFAGPLGYYERPPVEPVCKICGDTGWEMFERGGYTGAKPCAYRAL